MTSSRPTRIPGSVCVRRDSIGWSTGTSTTCTVGSTGSVLGGGSPKLRKGLVIAQVSLSLLLLIAAGLFMQSLRNLKTLNPGFEVKNLLAFDVDPTLNRYDRKWAAAYYRRLHERLNTLPGVEAHTFAVVPLLENDEWDNWVTIEGYQARDGTNKAVGRNFILADGSRYLFGGSAPGAGGADK